MAQHQPNLRPTPEPTARVHGNGDCPNQPPCPALAFQIDAEVCGGCGQCAEACPFDAISLEGPPNWFIAKTYHINQVVCKVCGACVAVCPLGGIELSDDP